VASAVLSGLISTLKDTASRSCSPCSSRSCFPSKRPIFIDGYLPISWPFIITDRFWTRLGSTVSFKYPCSNFLVMVTVVPGMPYWISCS